MNQQEMLGYISSFLGEGADDEHIENMLKSIGSKALAYCKQRKSLDSPELEGLAYAVCDIVVNRYRTNAPGTSEPVQSISSISDGDQSISFKTPESSVLTLSEFSDKEKQMLNEWRRLW